MIMIAVILGFPAVPWLIVGAIKAWRAYQDLRNRIELMTGVRPSVPPRP